MSYRVYKHTFPDGKIYVGMTKHTIKGRINIGYQHNPRMQNAVKTYGFRNTITEILADNLTYEEACEKECEFIAKFNSTDQNIGHNISYGGNKTYAGLKHTEEYRQMMSDRYMGRHFSEETLARMKDAHAKERMPVIMVSDDGTKTRFCSLTEAANAVGGFKTNVSRAVANRTKYKGCLWERG